MLEKKNTERIENVNTLKTKTLDEQVTAAEWKIKFIEKQMEDILEVLKSLNEDLEEINNG